MLEHDTHIEYFLSNTLFVLSLFGVILLIFVYCFRFQVEDVWPDAIFWAGIMTISLFFFWLLHHDEMLLVYVIVIMLISMIIWAIKF